MSEQQGLKLPPIHKEDSSPFKLPNDDQILVEGKRNAKDREQSKIWDKKTASCRTALKRFDKYTTELDDKYVPVNTFNNKEKKVIENALEVMQMRKKNKDLATKNETIVEILEQKKEMFLVTMTHEIIDKEINNLKSQANDREKALKESHQILEQDIQDFEQYQEKYKNDTKKIEEQFQRKVQNRLSKEQQIKSKQITVNSLRAQKSKNEKTIFSYKKYKEFLDQLPPKEWIESKESKKMERLDRIKQKLKSEWVIGRPKSKELEEEFERTFEGIVTSGDNEEIQEVLNNEEMYFKEPSELIEYFNNLEENNLFCIQNAQYAEQKYQELKARSQQKKKQLITKYQGHKDHKRQLQKQLSDLDFQIKHLRKKKEQNSTVLDEKDNKDIKSTISSEYQNMKETMHSYMPEIEYNAEALSFLSCIEICMERLWEKLRQCYHQNPKLIKEIKAVLERRKISEKREETTRTNQIEEEKRKMRNLEKKQPIVKIPGRMDMKRSPPQEKLVVKKVEVTGKDMDDDRKYLVD